MPEELLTVEDCAGAKSGCRILRLRGPILISNLFDFQTKVRSDTSLALILDLTGVPSIDSAGIGALVGAYISHQKNGRMLALVGVSERVRNSLKVTHVEPFFRFFDSLAAAEAAAA